METNYRLLGVPVASFFFFSPFSNIRLIYIKKYCRVNEFYWENNVNTIFVVHFIG